VKGKGKPNPDFAALFFRKLKLRFFLFFKSCLKEHAYMSLMIFVTKSKMLQEQKKCISVQVFSSFRRTTICSDD
jgi:hypothetical protein